MEASGLVVDFGSFVKVCWKKTIQKVHAKRCLIKD